MLCKLKVPQDGIQSTTSIHVTCNATGLSEQREREWRAEVRQAAQHAQQQARAAAEALAPVHELDPTDIAWGECKT